MDGMLQFYSQESLLFERFIPGFLLPGPMIYVPCNDSIVIAAATGSVECFKIAYLGKIV